jgi:hypothetical protein
MFSNTASMTMSAWDDVVVAQGGAQQAHALLVLVLAQLALGNLSFVVLADHTHATVDGLLLHLQQLHRDTSIEEAHRDAAAHGAGADHGDVLHLAGGGVVRHVGDLAGRALTEEGVLHGLGLRADHEGLEHLALLVDAGVDVVLRGDLDSVDAALRRDQATAGLGHVGTGFVEQAGIADHRCGQVAYTWQGAHRSHLQRKGLGTGEQITLDQLGNQLLARHLRQLVAGHRGTAGDHLQSHLDRQDARQALRATSAGDQTNVHLRQGHLHARGHHPVVATQRQFQAAAHHHTVDGGNDRLAAGFEGRDDGMQTRLGKRGRRAELANVGTTAKHLTPADDHHRLHAGVSLGLLKALKNTAAGAVPQTVDGRVVQGDDGDAAVDLVGGAHGNLGTLIDGLAMHLTHKKTGLGTGQRPDNSF